MMPARLLRNVVPLTALVAVLVVFLNMRQGNTQNVPLRATGTAFLINEDGYLLTCAHVVEGAAKVGGCPVHS